MEITRLLVLCSAMAYIRSAPTLAMLLVGWVMFLFLTRGGGRRRPILTQSHAGEKDSVHS